MGSGGVSFWGGPTQQSRQPMSENRRLCLVARNDGRVPSGTIVGAFGLGRVIPVRPRKYTPVRGHFRGL
jgi:hypothetical protein